jgi:hypothetical protein
VIGTYSVAISGVAIRGEVGGEAYEEGRGEACSLSRSGISYRLGLYGILSGRGIALALSVGEGVAKYRGDGGECLS